MAGSGDGISGMGLAAATAGGFLLYTGILNIPVLDGLRSALKGQKPVAGPQIHHDTSTLTTPANSNITDSVQGSLNSAILSAAEKYRGVPYRWAGTDPAVGMDCSGLVQRALQDVGLKGVPRTTGEFLVWSGAQTVATPEPGDLVCWVGHIGIYSGNGMMFNELKTGTVAGDTKIWSVPAPVYRRVKTNG